MFAGGRSCKHLPRAVRVENDANGAALAEAQWGAGRGYANVFYATIGTRIGTGIVLDGRVYHGRTVAAAEGGTSVSTIVALGADAANEVASRYLHLARQLPDARVQSLQTELTGGQLYSKFANGDIEAVTSETIGQAYEAGDPLATEVLEETIVFLALWWATLWISCSPT